MKRLNAKVYSYADPSVLRSDPAMQMLAGAPQICATGSLAWTLRSEVLQPTYGRSVLVTSIGRVFEQLLYPWSSPGLTVEQYAVLSAVLRELTADGGPQATSLVRSRSEVLTTLRKLAEAGWSPPEAGRDLRGKQVTDRTLEVFFEAWRRCVARSRSFGIPATHLHAASADKVRRRFTQSLQKVGVTGAHHRPPDRVVLHGFYFVTPLQQALLEQLSDSGIELIFANQHDPRFPSVFATWDAFFHEGLGLPPRAEWIRLGGLPPITDAASMLAEAVEGRGMPRVETTPGAVSVVEYVDLGSFIVDYRPPSDGSIRYYSAAEKELDPILRMYHPGSEPTHGRHFLNFPVGRFVLRLHEMVRDTARGIGIEAPALFECFASGLLRRNNVNGRALTHALTRLLPRLEGCYTREEWRSSLERLQSDVEAAVDVLDSRAMELDDGSGHTRWLLNDGNPLRRVSFLTVPAAEISQIGSLVEALFGLAAGLFESEQVTLGEHLSRLQELLSTGQGDGALTAEESRLVDQLMIRLKAGGQLTRLTLATADLVEAIAVFLGGALDNEEETGQEEEDEPVEARALVEAWPQVDALPFMQERAKAHVCLADDRRLPGTRSIVGWPLKAADLPDRTTSRASELLHLRAETQADTDLMLLFGALTWSEEVTLSYIQSYAGEETGLSPYGAILNFALEKRSGLLLDKGDGGNAMPAQGPAETRPPELESQSIAWSARLPSNALASWTVCPRRFVYDYAWQAMPTFSSDFHHGFLYGNLIRSLAQLKLPAAETEAAVAALFPHWTAVRRKDLLEAAPTPKSGRGRVYSGVNAPASSTRLQFLSKRHGNLQAGFVVGRSEDEGVLGLRVMESIKQSILSEEDVPEPTPGSHCRFCPHQSHCPAAGFSVDDE